MICSENGGVQGQHSGPCFATQCTGTWEGAKPSLVMRDAARGKVGADTDLATLPTVSKEKPASSPTMGAVMIFHLP